MCEYYYRVEHISEWLWGPIFLVSNQMLHYYVYKANVHDYGNHTNINIRLQSFHGRCSLKEYIKLKHTMEWLFDYNFYSEREKIKLTTSALYDDYAVWWNTLKRYRWSHGERPINTSSEMKVVMCKQHSRVCYKRFLSQDDDGMEDYYWVEKPQRNRMEES